MIKILIIDDEPLAIRRLEIKLSQYEDVEIVGTCQDGDAAVKLCDTTSANLVLLDIDMPGVDGLDVAIKAEECGIGVIFVTAFNQYAVKAFEQQAIDYLLKPVSKQRLMLALERFREKRTQNKAQEKISELRSVVAQLRTHSLNEYGPSKPDSFWIKDRGRRRKLSFDAIEWIEASRDYVSIHMVNDNAYFIRDTMHHFEKILDPTLFQRVHRSAIVNFSQIKGMNNSGGTLSLLLCSGSEVNVGRSYKTVTKLRLKEFA